MKRLLILICALIMTVLTVTGCSQKASNIDDTHGPITSNNQTISHLTVEEKATYTDKDHVAVYLYQFNHLPSNYITKKEAEALGWKDKGSLDKIAPGKSIGGDRYGDYEKKLPAQKGRIWKEADIDYTKGNRGPKRLIYSNDGLIYYTGDHYNTFQKIY